LAPVRGDMKERPERACFDADADANRSDIRLILEEAGGKVMDYRGGMLDLEGREIVASNGTLHAAMTTFTGEDDQ
jgi:hypothetical protein